MSITNLGNNIIPVYMTAYLSGKMINQFHCPTAIYVMLYESFCYNGKATPNDITKWSRGDVNSVLI